MAMKTVDATGLFCPGPVQILRGIIKRIEKGDMVELLADDSDTPAEVQEYCDEEGHTLVSVEEKDGVLYIKVIKNDM